jgi:hypothetical protein
MFRKYIIVSFDFSIQFTIYIHLLFKKYYHFLVIKILIDIVL